MKKYLKEYRNWWIIGSLALIIFLLISLLPGERKVFEIDDKCGPMMNLISHTVPDEAACRTRRRSQCGIYDMEYHKVKFEEAPVGCHTCTCTCKS